MMVQTDDIDYGWIVIYNYSNVTADGNTEHLSVVPGDKIVSLRVIKVTIQLCQCVIVFLNVLLLRLLFH